MEGSRRYLFGFEDWYSEDRFKTLLQRRLRDVRATIAIVSCWSGAAIAATDPFYRSSTLVA